MNVVFFFFFFWKLQHVTSKYIQWAIPHWLNQTSWKIHVLLVYVWKLTSEARYLNWLFLFAPNVLWASSEWLRRECAFCAFALSCLSLLCTRKVPNSVCSIANRRRITYRCKAHICFMKSLSHVYTVEKFNTCMWFQYWLRQRHINWTHVKLKKKKHIKCLLGSVVVFGHQRYSSFVWWWRGRWGWIGWVTVDGTRWWPGWWLIWVSRPGWWLIWVGRRWSIWMTIIHVWLPGGTCSHWLHLHCWII